VPAPDSTRSPRPSSEASDWVGRRIGGYRLLERIGEGSMGKVYRAHDPAGRDVALKVLTALTGKALRRFEREGEALAAVPPHRHVVTVHSMGVDWGVPFLVMDYVRGESLKARLRGGPLPLMQAVLIAERLGRALAHVHRAGVLHRDLKAANVLLRDELGEPVLTDFGMAQLGGAQRLTKTGDVFGTPVAMSPEQVLGRPVDAATDVWALGILLYQMLAGEPPFRGGSLAELCRKITEAPTPPLRERRPDVDPAVERIVACALAKDRRKRFESAAEMAAALRDWRDLQTKADSQAVLGGPPPPPRRPRPTLAVGLAAAGLLVLGGVGVAAWRQADGLRREREALASRVEHLERAGRALLTTVATGETRAARAAQGEAVEELAELEELAARPAAADVDPVTLERAGALLRAAAAADLDQARPWGPSAVAAIEDPDVAALVRLRLDLDRFGRDDAVDEAEARDRLGGPLDAAFRLLLARRLQRDRPGEALELIAGLPAELRARARVVPELLVGLEERGPKGLIDDIERLSPRERRRVGALLRQAVLAKLDAALASHQAEPADLTRLLELLTHLPGADAGPGPRPGELADRIVGRCCDLLRPIVEREFLGAALRGTASPTEAEHALAGLAERGRAVAELLRALGESGLRPTDRRRTDELADDVLVIGYAKVFEAVDYTRVVQALVRLDVDVPRSMLGDLFPPALEPGPTREYLALRYRAQRADEADDQDDRRPKAELLAYMLDEGRAAHLGPLSRARGLLDGIHRQTPYEEARRALDLASALAPEDPWVLVQRAAVLAVGPDPGERREACALVDRAIELHGRHHAGRPATMFQRFLVYEDAIEIHARYGEVERAQVIYEEAREADPPFAPGELGDLRQELENSLQWRLEREESE